MQNDDQPGFGSILLGFVLVLLLIFGIGWVAQGNDFFMYKYFASKQEAVRRQVFEQTKSYNDGLAQEIQNMRMQYQDADDQHKELIKSIVRQRTANVDINNLNDPGLRAFILQCRGF